jgi:hypothetical protein
MATGGCLYSQQAIHIIISIYLIIANNLYLLRRTVNHCFPEGVLGEDIALETGMLPLEPASHPKLEAPYCLHLPVIRAMKIRLGGPDIGMTHQSLNSSEVISVVQEGSGEGVPHYVEMNPLLDEAIFFTTALIRQSMTSGVRDLS